MTLSISSISADHAISRVAEGGQVSTSFQTTSLFILPESLPLCCLKAALGALLWYGLTFASTIRVSKTQGTSSASDWLRTLTSPLSSCHWGRPISCLVLLRGGISRSLRRHLPWGIFHYCRYYKERNHQHYARDRWLLNENFESLGRRDLDCSNGSGHLCSWTCVLVDR